MFAGRKELHVFLFADKVATAGSEVSMTFKFSRRYYIRKFGGTENGI